MEIKFVTIFRNSSNDKVAGTWFDEERREWRVSTVPVRGFASEQDAIAFFHLQCDPETGLPYRRV
jgi:hypothetical protein